MATLLQIKHGSTTIDLTAGAYMLEDYEIAKPRRGDVVVEDKISMVISGTATAIQTAIQNIEKAFTQAEARYDDNRGDRVYLHFQLDGLSTEFRSEIVRPDVDQPCGDVYLPKKNLGINWARLQVKTELRINRIAWWEAASETELSISNGGGSGTGGITIRNAHHTAAFTGATVSFTLATSTIADSGNGFGIFSVGDVISVRGSAGGNDGIYTVATASAAAITTVEPLGGNEGAGATITIYDIINYVHVAAANIAGDVPAATRLVLENTQSIDNLATIWIGRNFQASPSQFAHFLEIGDSDTGSNTVDANCANGIKRTYTITTTEAKITGWVIPSETLSKANAGFFKFLTRFAAYTYTTDIRWRLKVYYGTTCIWSGGQVQFDDTYAPVQEIIRAIDTVQLPPFTLEGQIPADLTLQIWGKSTAGVSRDISIDYAVLLSLDSYRWIRSQAGLNNGSFLVDDGVERHIYQRTNVSEIVKDIATSGFPLMLYPGKDNRIYFQLHSDDDGDAAYNRSASIRLYYRQRVSTI